MAVNEVSKSSALFYKAKDVQSTYRICYVHLCKNTNNYYYMDNGVLLNKYKTFSVLIYSLIYQHEWNWENEKSYGNTTPKGRSVFIQFRVFPTSTSVDITICPIYQYGKNVLYFFYNIAMSKAQRIRKISMFTSGGKFPVLTLSYINTALSQSAFRIYQCYIIIQNLKCVIAMF
jgi:hypothetical protein